MKARNVLALGAVVAGLAGLVGGCKSESDCNCKTHITPERIKVVLDEDGGMAGEYEYPGIVSRGWTDETLEHYGISKIFSKNSVICTGEVNFINIYGERVILYGPANICDDAPVHQICIVPEWGPKRSSQTANAVTPRYCISSYTDEPDIMNLLKIATEQREFIFEEMGLRRGFCNQDNQ
ncbi:MAG: hypothetical protein V1734_02200 [Nanoarchaeota archaeon]